MQQEQQSIRHATLGDVATITELTDAAYANYVPIIGRKPQPMTTDYYEFVGQNPVWVLEVNQQVVGVLALKNETDTLLIYSVAIQPAYQKQGYGRLLLAWAEQEADKAGYQTIRLYTNSRMEQNIALYTRLGYVETGREAVGNGLRVNMSKKLNVQLL